MDVLARAESIALSYERLQPDKNEDDAQAQALLSLAACFAPGESIPRQLLLATLVSNTKSAFMENTLQVSDALTRLVALGLVTEGAAGGIRLHQLLAHFVSGAAGETGAQAAVEQAVIAETRRLNKMGNPARLRLWQVHLRHITAVAQSRNDKRFAQLANELGVHLSQEADFAAARPYLAQALAIREKLFGPEHPQTAQSLNDLGVLSSKTGKYELAQRYHERALAIREEVLGAAHLDTTESLNNLGATMVLMGTYEEARPYYERALAIRRKLLGENHPHIAHSLGGLGVLLYGWERMRRHGRIMSKP